MSTTCFTLTTMFISSLSPVYGLLRVILRKVLYAQHHYSPAFVRTIRTYLSICPKMHKAPIVRNGTDQGFLGVIGSSYALIRDVLSLGARLAARNQWPPERGSTEADRIYWAACSSGRSA